MYNIEWINYKPVDEPHCGYDGSKCPRPQGLTETLAAVLGGKVWICEKIHKKYSDSIEQHIF